MVESVSTDLGGDIDYIAWTDVGDDALLRREEIAFRRLIPTLSQYQNEFVAIAGGQFAGHAPNKNALLRDFFSSHAPTTIVFIGFIGNLPPARVRA
jgi:hypothetical protein